MQSSHLKVLALAELMAAAGFTAVAAYFLSATLPNFQDRPVAGWQPDAGAKSPTFNLAEPVIFDAALQAPLFRMNRKPFVPVVQAAAVPALVPAAAPPPPAPPPQIDARQFRLLGVSLAGASAKALLITPEKPQGDWYGVGEALSGWSIVAIDQKQVELRNGEEKAVVPLYVDNLAKPVGAP